MYAPNGIVGLYRKKYVIASKIIKKCNQINIFGSFNRNCAIFPKILCILPTACGALSFHGAPYRKFSIHNQIKPGFHPRPHIRCIVDNQQKRPAGPVSLRIMDPDPKGFSDNGSRAKKHKAWRPARKQAQTGTAHPHRSSE